MRRRKLALTGPHAAALYGLEGFRDLDWPLRWCSPVSGESEVDVIRTRQWAEPTVINGIAVAPISLVLRHLGDIDAVGNLSARDRLELAVEHALREAMATVDDLRVAGGAAPGDTLLREVLRLRRDEPPTESYAETRTVQLLRSFGYEPWRQLPVVEGGKTLHRVDLVIPFATQPRSRPEIVRPSDGLLIEIDSREFHSAEFEKDHRRQSNYDRLGYHWVTFTPTQIERSVGQVRAAIAGAMRRSRATTLPSPRNRPERTATKTPAKAVARNRQPGCADTVD